MDDETTISYGRLRDELAAQTGRALVHPVFFGSAVTGAGLDSLIAGIAELLPAAEGDVDGPVSGTVFKVERGPAGEKIAYVRMFSGTVRARDRLRFGRDDEEKVTAISVFEQRLGRAEHVRRARGRSGSSGASATSGSATRSAIRATGPRAPLFRPADAGDGRRSPPPRRTRARLHAALAQLADQDPLINLRQDDVRQEISVSLYGEVQKEVIGATLADEFGIDVTFRETTTICIERPVGTGAAFEIIDKEPNPFLATVGLRVEPAEVDSGVEFRLESRGSGRCRSRSSRRSRRPCRRPCARGSTAGRSPTARSP